MGEDTAAASFSGNRLFPPATCSGLEPRSWANWSFFNPHNAEAVVMLFIEGGKISISRSASSEAP